MNIAFDSIHHKVPSEQKPNLLLNIAILALSLFGTLLLVEGALRVVGFSHRLYPEKLEFGYPDFQTMESKYVEDPDLFWTPKEYKDRLTKLISRSPEIIFMGDSCTQFGNYDTTVRSLLKRTYPEKNIRAAKIGVAGWASYQGRRQMERDVIRIKPKIATIYYGWNDHWIGFGIEDKEIATLHSPFWSFVNRLRIVQLGTKAYLAFGKKERSDIPMRVALPDYKENLATMITTARTNGITPVIIAAPTSQIPGKEPAYLKGRFLVRLEDLVPLHQSYLAAAKEVATREGAVFCDLYADFKTLPQRDLEMKYFKNSGIHLTPQGDEILGKFLFDCLQRNKLLEGM